METRVMKIASREKRLGAYLIDKAIPFILGCISFSAIIRIANSSINSYGYGYGYGYGEGFEYGYSMPGNGAGAVASLMICLLITLAYLGVEIYFYTKSASIGKTLLGMKVISSENGEPIGIWKMLLREWIVKDASAAVFCLGYFWVLIDERNRSWHDKILDTYVIDLKESEKLQQKEDEEYKNKEMTE